MEGESSDVGVSYWQGSNGYVTPKHETQVSGQWGGGMAEGEVSRWTEMLRDSCVSEKP